MVIPFSAVAPPRLVGIHISPIRMHAIEIGLQYLRRLAILVPAQLEKGHQFALVQRPESPACIGPVHDLSIELAGIVIEGHPQEAGFDVRRPAAGAGRHAGKASRGTRGSQNS